jgi:hypothetical protein
MKEHRSSFIILIGKPTGKRHLVIPRRRWKGKILEYILKKYVSIRGIGLILLRIGIIGESL